jgi:(E)-4-hydroxy-3-methylbut-2-enyl-diphosphate synthase
VVVSDFLASGENLTRFLERSGHPLTNNNTLEKGETGPDYIYLGDFLPDFPLPGIAGFILNYRKWINLKKMPENLYPLFTTKEYQDLDNPPERLHFLHINIPSDEGIIDMLKQRSGKSTAENDLVLVLTAKKPSGVYGQFSFIKELRKNAIHLPVVLSRVYDTDNLESLQVKSGCDFGRFFIDAVGDGIWLRNHRTVSVREMVDTSFGILQACRARITRPEYISCPSCGRSTFNLQEVTKEIQKSTAHLKGIKIGIMGCIVNGPGEMADADYGYVGAGKGTVTLFQNNKIVKKGVSSDKAVHELINLIKESGDWIDP